MRELDDADGAGGPADPAMTAELLLALRMALADGGADARTRQTLDRIGCRDLKLDPSGVGEVIDELENMLTSVGRAGVAAVMRDLPLERRRTLALRIAAIAAADEELQTRQERLAGRLGVVLGLEAGE